MPEITPALVPTIAPGQLFSRLTTDDTLAIRFLTALDPAYFEALNRPHADIALRQLIIAKTLDQLNVRLGHQALFPFIDQPLVHGAGSSPVDVPLALFWDMHVSLPQKWERLRLAKIKRLSGSDDADSGGTGGKEFTGKLRLIFTAQEQGSTSEVAVLMADVKIDGDTLYQVVRVAAPTSADDANAIPVGEAQTVAGFIIFRTLDPNDLANQAFLNAVAPPIAGPVDSQGNYITPPVYQIVDSSAPGDFSLTSVSHGTGMLISSAWNAIPALDSDLQVFLETLNYPFGLDASRQSASPITVTIPAAMFREFDIAVPAGDEPAGDISGTFFPVWVNRIVRNDAPSTSLTWYFATHNVTDDTPSTAPVEFATLTLTRTMTEGQIVPIIPLNNLFLKTGLDAALWQQGFGRGHVVLSTLWGGSTSAIQDFFDAFIPVIDIPASVLFSQPNTRVSSFGLSRVPKTIPTVGQAQALRGSKDGEVTPSSTNRYVVEGDQGLGDQVDFATNTLLPPDKRNNQDIERFGYTGSLAHRVVRLVIAADGVNHDYTVDILPRLRILLGRDPIFGDFWWDGTRVKFFNGDTWQG